MQPATGLDYGELVQCHQPTLRSLVRWGWGVNFSGEKHYEDVRFNVISVMRVGGVQF